ncbi:D-tagatose 3-epimerase [Branchiibius hedensis]|uniref:D-tagatose 3-epimerase n=1 Tax=Branchiibius hedensis TaxID=672460 RepID=A0A2Y9A207_9MICO|nr:sugar phosphate isomerase/epimerase family protein [Branchiibius hedensis]PWJ27427.1 D-tagatose 3-epimerase [Branchiibius hedensis]SSA36237.1 D-tagatose 3-epimerase [Branchiibius hedensis]
MSVATNSFGVHALVWRGGTTPDDVTAIAEQTAAAGYDLVEFSLHDSVNMDVDHARKALQSNGLRVTCSRGLALDADVSSEDPAVVSRGAQLLADSLELTAAIGGELLTGALYSAFGKAPAPLSRKGRENVVSVLQDLSKEAEQTGVTLGLEICNRYETNVVNTTRDALRLADDIGSDNVVIHLDTYHMNIEESDFVTPVLDAADRLGYVHIGENHRGYMGSGHLDFTSFFGALARIGYSGTLTFESFSSAVLASGLSNDLAIWRNLWDDGDDLARHALGYMRQGMHAAYTR